MSEKENKEQTGFELFFNGARFLIALFIFYNIVDTAFVWMNTTSSTESMELVIKKIAGMAFLAWATKELVSD